MFIVDKLLMSPVTGVLWIMKELHKHVQQEQAQESDRLTAKLSELYMLLETNQISSEEFDSQESQILDRLDELQADAAASAEGEENEEEGDTDEDGAVIDAEEENDGSGDEDEDEDEDGEADDQDQEGDDEASVPEATADGNDSDDLEAMLLAEIESRAKPVTKSPGAPGDDHPPGKDRNT